MIRAMIFAAGLGTRLRPITDHKPKALVEVGGITLLEHAVRHLSNYSIQHLVINVHHFAQQVVQKARELEQKYAVEVRISDETEQLLETGGGLKKASDLFTGASAILLYNVDILSNLNLQQFIEYYQQQKPLALLSVRSRKTSRYFLFNENMELCGWKNMQNNEIRIQCSKVQKLKPFAFSGIQIVNPELLQLLKPWEGAFSMTEVYIRLCAYYRILGQYDPDSFWMDVGTMEKLEEANKQINNIIL